MQDVDLGGLNKIAFWSQDQDCTFTLKSLVKSDKRVSWSLLSAARAASQQACFKTRSSNPTGRNRQKHTLLAADWKFQIQWTRHSDCSFCRKWTDVAHNESNTPVFVFVFSCERLNAFPKRWLFWKGASDRRWNVHVNFAHWDKHLVLQAPRFNKTAVQN